jgi:ATP-binding protein involved in chromosome partitioning
VPLLGEIPLYQRVLEGGDTGRPIVVAEPESGAARALAATAAQLRQVLDTRGAAIAT